MKYNKKNNTELNIKIFVSNRIDLESEAFDSNILCPVRCGAIFDNRENISMLGDNTGENISNRRMTFCEQTVQYWAWKNVEADYYGLFHYRRFFNFSEFDYEKDIYGNVVDTYIDKDTAWKYGLCDNRMKKIIEKYDLIVPQKIDVSKFPEHPKTVWEHWCNAKDLYEKDLEILLSVINRLQPDYYKIANEYLKGKYAYFCGMHVMKKELFFNYCEWLYPILFELEKEIDISPYSQEGQRTVGHLAERLLGIYIFYLKTKGASVRIKELQVVMFNEPQKVTKTINRAFNGENNVIPVVLASSAVFAPVCAVAVNSIIENSNGKFNYDIVILETDIKEKDKQLITSIAQDRTNISIRFFYVKTLVKEYDLTANEHISVETYYRFLIQSIMPQYDKVLYLDSDLVCNTDIAELYYTNIEGYMLGAVHDVDMCGQINLKNSKVAHYLYKELKMENPFEYFQAGVLLLNTKEMREAYTMEQWLTFAQKKYRYCDQDVLNRYCQGRVYYLNMAWNVLIDCNNYRVPVLVKGAPAEISKEYFAARKEPKIIHFAGFEKPWERRNVDLEEFFWKYARRTPYYENFLIRVMLNENNTVGISKKGAIKEKVKKYCPEGTRRYRFAKWCLQKYRRVTWK